MFKDILVPMVMGDMPEAAIRAACAIASHDRAHVDALVGVSTVASNAAVWAYCPEGFYETLKEAAEAAIQEQAARAKERLARESVPHGVRQYSTIWLSTAEMTAVCARYADLIVLDRSAAARGRARALFGSLLAGSGRPVLLVPDEAADRDRFARIVVAWKPCREATRALHDALPFLWRAHSVDLLRVADDDAGRDPGEDSDETRLLAHLSHQGVNATFVRRRRDGAAAGRRILEFAASVRADLIVAGGYSRSRAREHAFGGVTTMLYERAACPVFFSH